MKNIKTYLLAGVTALTLSSCNDFLSTLPKDAMSPSTTWKTRQDAEKFIVGCYDGWESGAALLYWDAGSDFAYNNFPWEGFTNIGNGSLSPSDPGWSFYNFVIIGRCNTVLDNIDKCNISDEAIKKDLIAQVKAIRAYSYFRMGFLYGGVPIVKKFTSAKEAQVPRNTEQEVKDYVFKDLEEAIADINATPTSRGHIAKGAALAIKMRAALYWGEYQKAKEAAQAIIDLGQYQLESNYADLFKLTGRNSNEIILAVQHKSGTYPLSTIGQLYNNGDGGWSSVVPTQKCVDNYEMSNGLTIDEVGSGYDATHPFHGRDPRMAMTILFPGSDWDGGVFNTLDENLNGKKNPNYPSNAANSSKTALTWRKYLDPKDQYADVWDTECNPIVFRYAEVLLTWAEAENELNGPSAAVYAKINMVRHRAGMPDVDQSKYNTKETLRELIHRERGAEFAGEGLRRADILRWKKDGKMLAESVLNGELVRITGTVNNAVTDPTMRATVNGTRKIEDRTFKPYNRYLPIPQKNISDNPKLEQNPGYAK